MNFSHLMYYLIAFLSLINFARLAAMIIAADIYDIRQIRKLAKKPKKRDYHPLVSIIIPAYNEEMVIERSLQSAWNSTYEKVEIIVVSDGSTDGTVETVKRFIKSKERSYNQTVPKIVRTKNGLKRIWMRGYSPISRHIKLVEKRNGGKAAAINEALRKWAKGDLVMILDADSVIRPDAVTKMVEHFKDPRVIASAANVKIINTWSALGIAQRFEYLVSYRLKRAQTTLNMEYIIGGVGSTFQRQALLDVGLFDTDTITEDIDLTVKLIHHFGNRDYRINYASDVIVYTEHVQKFKSLIKQRLRWKYGRFQVFMKHRNLFFGDRGKYTKRLTWYQLPYALFGELMLLLEPILVGFILFVIFKYGDLTSLVSVYLIITSYVFINLLGETTESIKTKLKLSVMLPLIYFMLYLVAAVEFIALIKSLRSSKKLFKPLELEESWEHVERSGQKLASI